MSDQHMYSTPELPDGGLSQQTSKQEDAAAKKRPRRAQLIIAGITAALMLYFAASTALDWPRVEVGPSADIPTNEISGWVDPQDWSTKTFTFDWEREMNEALQSGDKEAFLANAEGQAKELLNFWWEGTREVGWDYAFAFRTIEEGSQEHLNFGMKLDFGAQPARSSGSPDAGLELTQQFGYKLTLEGEGDDAIITALEPKEPMPWDEGPIYVQKREHVVLFATEEERALVDENIDLAEEAAVDTFAAVASIGGEASTDGFTVVITDDQERFDYWSGSLEELANMEVAGFASSTVRPHRRTEFMPAEIATGAATSGSWVGMGPKSAASRRSTFVHEFAHVVHESALPYSFYAYPATDPVEGFAEFISIRVENGGGYSLDPRAKEFIFEHGQWSMTEERLRNPDAYLGYWAAASYFQFVEATGGSAWQLAMDRDEGLFMSQRAQMQGPEFGEEEWLSWVAQQ